MKLIRKTFIGNQEVFDIEVAKDHHYILEDGLVSHNSGFMYMADIIILLSKAKAKEEGTKDQIGVEITCRVNKSRYMQEGKMVKLLLSFKHGLFKYSYLTSIGKSLNLFKKDGNSLILPDGKKVSMKDMRAPKTSVEYFTPEVLRAVRDVIKKEFEFGNESEI